MRAIIHSLCFTKSSHGIAITLFLIKLSETLALIGINYFQLVLIINNANSTNDATIHTEETKGKGEMGICTQYTNKRYTEGIPIKNKSLVWRKFCAVSPFRSIYPRDYWLIASYECTHVFTSTQRYWMVRRILSIDHPPGSFIHSVSHFE